MEGVETRSITAEIRHHDSTPPPFPQSNVGMSIPMAINGISGGSEEGGMPKGLSLSLESGGSPHFQPLPQSIPPSPNRVDSHEYDPFLNPTAASYRGGVGHSHEDKVGAVQHHQQPAVIKQSSSVPLFNYGATATREKEEEDQMLQSLASFGFVDDEANLLSMGSNGQGQRQNRLRSSSEGQTGMSGSNLWKEGSEKKGSILNAILAGGQEHPPTSSSVWGAAVSNGGGFPASIPNSARAPPASFHPAQAPLSPPQQQQQQQQQPYGAHNHPSPKTVPLYGPPSSQPPHYHNGGAPMMNQGYPPPPPHQFYGSPPSSPAATPHWTAGNNELSPLTPRYPNPAAPGSKMTSPPTLSSVSTSSLTPPGPNPSVVYQVKFKRTTRSFLPSPHPVQIGQYVLVEADRGVDLGVVVGRISWEKFTKGKEPVSLDLKKINRPATDPEVKLLLDKAMEEATLLKICRQKVKQRSLPMNILDSEYQFDRHKLTFFFEADGRIDFRELVRDLFSIYKTRIWMQQVDKGAVEEKGIRKL
ncbi:hypothetical protein TrST_g8995 [Triparma strigata]|uniref:PSP1 C-terminal domain-containing protein n=1 Tax=Triparma strigata TaxID=1606541 RepID=A0A9W7BHE9_9STRA|nr:hypothetical protein TrST_g8995 [Triparma strigata]